MTSTGSGLHAVAPIHRTDQRHPTWLGPCTHDRLRTRRQTAATLPPSGSPASTIRNCRSDAPPVVLLHGTFSTVASNFSAMAPALQASGRCVYALGYGSNGTAPVRSSADEVAAFIQDGARRHRRRSGRRRRVLPGRAGAADRAADDGLAAPVGTAVLIAPSFHGTTHRCSTRCRPACARHARTSEPGRRCSPNWTPAATWTATCATWWSPPARTRSSPRWRRRFPPVRADRVQSLVVQDRCPADAVDHVAPAGRPGGHRLDGRGAGRTGRPDPAAFACS